MKRKKTIPYVILEIFNNTVNNILKTHNDRSSLESSKKRAIRFTMITIPNELFQNNINNNNAKIGISFQILCFKDR